MGRPLKRHDLTTGLIEEIERPVAMVSDKNARAREYAKRTFADRLSVLDFALKSGASEYGVAQMGWEQRGNNSYYYKKEREGSRVKSVYVGRGEIAHMVAQLQSSSPLLERFARSMKSPEVVKAEKAETALEQASDLIQLIAQAALLTAGYHTHKRQWRRKRDVSGS